MLSSFIFTTTIISPTQAAFNLGPTSLYIIKINPRERASVESSVRNTGGSIDKKFQYAFDGYVVKMPETSRSSFENS
jgi:predicted ATP-grasp superfamily ATP-dependent carboligase